MSLQMVAQAQKPVRTSLMAPPARNSGLTQQNPFGIAYLLADKLETITVGYPSPLSFERELNLSAKVNEDGVVQILANVIHSR